MNETQVRELLQNKKLKVTPNRLNLLIKMDKYGSAMSYSTIQKAFQENNEIYYAICDMNCNENHRCHEHIHFKCIECETIQCKDLGDTLENLVPNLQIHKISINLEGLCEKCI